MSQIEPPKTTLAFGARVIKVEERIEKKWITGAGPDAEFADVSKGWFVTLDGSHESIFAGMSKPNINKGDLAHIRIDFDAQPK